MKFFNSLSVILVNVSFMTLKFSVLVPHESFVDVQAKVLGIVELKVGSRMFEFCLVEL